MFLLQTLSWSHFIQFLSKHYNVPATNDLPFPTQVKCLCLHIFIKALSSSWNILPGRFYPHLSQGDFCEVTSDDFSQTPFVSQFSSFTLPLTTAGLCLTLLLKVKAHI